MNDYTVLDTETTGLDVFRDKIVELSWPKVVDGEEVYHRSYVVNPGGVIMPDHVAQIHGITQEMAEQGTPIREVLSERFTDIGDEPIVGQNIISFDWPLITYAVMRDDPAAPNPMGLMPRLIDTMALYKSTLMGALQQHGQTHLAFARYVLDARIKGLRFNLKVACEALGVEPGEGRLHTARYDVQQTHGLLQVLIERGVRMSLDGSDLNWR